MAKPLRLTKKMKMALERLYQANGCAYVSLSTADALRHRELVTLPRHWRQRTQGGRFPEYEVILTAAGWKVCKQYFKTIKRYSNTQHATQLHTG
jgi:hypothetical protein